jgi:hypothetical protein
MDKPPMTFLASVTTSHRVLDDKKSPVSDTSSQTPMPGGPGGPEPVTGTRALATVLFNSTEAFISTQGSFGLRAPLMYGFVESSMGLLTAAMRRNGYEIKPGTHEYIWAKSILTMIAHRAAAPLVGAVNGGLGVSTMLVRVVLNTLIDIPRRINAWRRDAEPLPSPPAYLQLPVNRDLRILTDDIATYAFDAMVFGRTLQTTTVPTSVPSGMRPGTMTARAGLLPSPASQSSGLAIFASVLAGHLRVWSRDGRLEGKAPPSARIVLGTAGDRILSRMQACRIAMDARLTIVLRSGTVSNSISIPAWLLIGLASASGNYLKDNPIASGLTVAGLTTAAFHAFGPQWGDQKFIRELKRPDLQRMSSTPDDGYASRYRTYMEDQDRLQRSDRDPCDPGVSRQTAFRVVCGALQAMAVSAMATEYLSHSGEPGLVVGAPAWQSFLTEEHSVQSTWAACLVGLGVGAVTVLASQALSQEPTPISGPLGEELRGGEVEPRAEGREAFELRQMIRIVASDVLFASLYGAGAITAPTAILASIGAAVVNSIDTEQLGLSPTIGSMRSRMNAALNSIWTRLGAQPSNVAPTRSPDALLSPSRLALHSRDLDPFTSPSAQAAREPTLEMADMLNTAQAQLDSDTPSAPDDTKIGPSPLDDSGRSPPRLEMPDTPVKTKNTPRKPRETTVIIHTPQKP